ncbi:ketimine reductase mu-crystallin-like isoform X2 [Uloborus diversus]|uniref:ketimine reductase mu-crystallin-like isoform X2 n=1 Tax=Uloborus diversus TaxID=327109 RepID=UPI002409419F|nr:ketimine reductase mu-crystallin-like isoform X2 [Uloborus diversus]
MATESGYQPIYLNKEKVLECLQDEWGHLIEETKRALKSYSAGKVEQPIRILFAMPAYDSEKDALATKIVTVYPENKKFSIPAIQAVILLYDSENGNLKAILDGEVITKMRTAAASVVATMYLAPKSPRYLAILGAGAQARSHFQALSHVYSFKKIFIWNLNSESGMQLVGEIIKEGFSCELCSSVEDAVKEADIIVTVTMATKPILRKEWIKEGAHINAVGAPVPEWQELEKDLMLSSVVYVDSKEGALTESGDIIQSGASIYAEIGEVILGIKEAYPNKTTIFKSLGMAVEDVVTAEIVYEKHSKNIRETK